MKPRKVEIVMRKQADAEEARRLKKGSSNASSKNRPTSLELIGGPKFGKAKDSDQVVRPGPHTNSTIHHPTLIQCGCPCPVGQIRVAILKHTSHSWISHRTTPACVQSSTCEQLLRSILMDRNSRSRPNETTSLLLEEPSRKDSPLPKPPPTHWKIWRSSSSHHRFFLLFFTCCIPFGGHFVKNSMSSLEQFMLDDPAFPISNMAYGGLLSAVSVPNMISPFFGGAIIDRLGHASVLSFLWVMLAGQIVFTLAMSSHSYAGAMVGRVLFGLGEGCVVVSSRVMVSHWFQRRELTFAMGASVAMANVAKMLAKSSIAPIALYFGSYLAAMWASVAICVFSLVMGLLVFVFTRKIRLGLETQLSQGQDIDRHMMWLVSSSSGSSSMMERDPGAGQEWNCVTTRSFSRVFWILTLLHVVFINVFHLFQNVSSSFLHQQYHYSIVHAGYVSSLSHSLVIFAPLVGYFVDRVDGRMAMILLASVISTLVYTLLLFFPEISPVYSMMLISFCLSFLPAILMASVALVVTSSSFGVAFGIIEITDAIGASVGNLAIGYLRDRTGNYTVDMYALLGLSLLALVLALVLWTEFRRSKIYFRRSKWNHGRFDFLRRLSSIDDEDHGLATEIVFAQTEAEVSDSE